MKKIKLFLAAVAAMVTMGVNAQTWTGNAVAEGTFYLYNVGADKFLNAGDPKEDWGTNAWLSTNSNLDVTLARINDGEYTIDTKIQNGNKTAERYLNNSTWCDGTATHWQFRAVAGETNVYQIVYDGRYIMANEDLNDVEMVGDPAGRTTSTYWKLVTKADRIAALAYASPSNPMDATFLIEDANFGRNDTRVSAWTMTANNKNLSGGNNKNNCAESYHSDFSLSQTLSGIPNGTYKMTAQGFYRKDGDANDVLPYFYLGESTVNFPVKSGSENSMSDASVSFTKGSYTVSPISALVSNESITVGAKLEGQDYTTDGAGLWCIFDNFQLTYYGNTVSITNADFSDGTTGWTSGNNTPAVNQGNGEFWGGKIDTYDMSQTITGLSAGIYALEVQGYYRQGNQDTRGKNQESLDAFLYATGNNITYSTALLSIYDEAGQNGSVGTNTVHGYIPNSQADAASYFTAGLYEDNKVLVDVGSDGNLTIGIRENSTTDGYDWACFDNFSVTKLGYSTLADAYSAEWTSRKAAATTLLNNSDYANILNGDAARTTLSNAINVTPTDLEGYYSALVTLRAAVNGFKASKYAYDQYATKVAPVIAAENTTYGHITGTEKTTFDTNVTNVVGSMTKNAENYYNLITQTTAFTGAKAAYDEYYYENETATRLGADVTSVTAPTTAAEATTAAHAINVTNYQFLEDKGYEDVSAKVLGAWTDNNVVSRTGQHYDGTGNGGSQYFEQNTGWGTAAYWEMSRQQTVNLSAGVYVLKVAARVSSGADAELSVTVGSGEPIVTYAGHHGDSGLGITTSGEACYTSHADDDTKVYANNNNGRGFEWRYIPFTLATDGSVTLKFHAENVTNGQYEYVSFTSLGIWTDPAVAAKTDLLTAINNATAAYNNGANVGASAFQIPAAAGTTISGAITTAQGVYDDASATKQQVIDATSTLNTAVATYQAAELNAPAAGDVFNVMITTGDDYAFKNNPLTFNADNSSGAFFAKGVGVNANRAQQITFTKVSGNQYTLSMVNAEGNPVYLATNLKANETGSTSQIRLTTDAAKALNVEVVPTATAGVYNLRNTEANALLGCQDSDANATGGIYTTGVHNDFTITAATKPSVTVSCKAGKFGTVVFPFAPSVTANSDVKFYTVTGVNNGYVQLEEAKTLAANTPYMIKNEGSELYSETLTGWGTATADQVGTTLVGVYTAATIAASEGSTTNYVLQTQDNTQAFYKVDAAFTATAYKCYLTVTNSEVKAFFFDSEDAINGIEAETENAEIYNLAGQRVNKAQKGIYIINGKKVLVK